MKVEKKGRWKAKVHLIGVQETRMGEKKLDKKANSNFFLKKQTNVRRQTEKALKI